jgi:hypothetical protein
MTLYFSTDWFYEQNPQVSVSGRNIDDSMNIDKVCFGKIFSEIDIEKNYTVNKDPIDILKEANLKSDNIFTIHFDFYIENFDLLFTFETNLNANINGKEIHIKDSINNEDKFTLHNKLTNSTKYNVKFSDFNFDF